MWFTANHHSSCTGTSRDGPPGSWYIVYSCPGWWSWGTWQPSVQLLTRLNPTIQLSLNKCEKACIIWNIFFEMKLNTQERLVQCSYVLHECKWGNGIAYIHSDETWVIMKFNEWNEMSPWPGYTVYDIWLKWFIGTFMITVMIHI